MVIHSHAGDLLVAGQISCLEVDEVLSEMAKCLRLERRDREFEYCCVQIGGPGHQDSEADPADPGQTEESRRVGDRGRVNTFTNIDGQLQWIAPIQTRRRLRAAQTGPVHLGSEGEGLRRRHQARGAREPEHG
eukprot:9391959-Pyramimonas_sp.AAC.1